MDFVTKVFKEYDSAFMLRLKDVGMTGDLARHFILETASATFCAIKNTSLEKTVIIMLSDDPSQLLKSLNADSLAINLAISKEQVCIGLETIAPVMNMVFIQKSNEIVAATASLAWHHENDKAEVLKIY